MIGAEHKIDFILSNALATIIPFVDPLSFAIEMSERSSNMNKISYESVKKLKESHEASKFCDRCMSRRAFDNCFAVITNANTRSTDL